jgi:hypothetical protein
MGNPIKKFSHTEIHKRIDEFQECQHCWQYQIRIENIESDLEESGLSREQVENLSINDFEFRFLDKKADQNYRLVKEFIIKHEWLGKMPVFTTHLFGAFYKDKLAGVVVMSTPYMFSNILGKDNKHLEKTISRGACISWSPKNLASALLSWSIKWMVRNTEFRVFSAYSDPEAKELGTVYQAINAIYVGQTSGRTMRYLDPENEQRGWFGSRSFGDRSTIVRVTKSIGIEWQKDWYTEKRKVNWKEIPEDVTKKIKEAVQKYKNSCKSKPSLRKHKYILIKGVNKREQKHLLGLFSQNNPKLKHENSGNEARLGLPYPKNRGEG